MMLGNIEKKSLINNVFHRTFNKKLVWNKFKRIYIQAFLKWIGKHERILKQKYYEL